ncbi:MAG: phytochelatin synthase family protein [Comamonas sp.]
MALSPRGAALSLRLRRFALIVGAATLSLTGFTTPAHARAPSASQALEIPSHLFALTHPIGQQRLIESNYRQAYWPLSAYFETQRNQAYCSVATSVIALNALGIARPATALYPDYSFFTQQDFFAGVDPRIAQPEVVAKEGMTLEQLGKVLASHPVRTETVFADTLDAGQLRALLMKHLREQDRFVLLNFNRPILGEVGGGHWSPLAAYHEASDSVLLMDVARYKYPPVWVPLTELLRGAQDHDSVSGKARGLIVVQGR